MGNKDRLIYKLEWDKNSINLGMNQLVTIDHSHKDYVLVRPAQKTSTPGVHTPSLTLEPDNQYLITVVGETTESKQAFLWGIDKNGETLFKRSAYIKSENSKHHTVSYTYTHSGDKELVVEFGILFGDPSPKDRLKISEFTVESLEQHNHGERGKPGKPGKNIIWLLLLNQIGLHANISQNTSRKITDQHAADDAAPIMRDNVELGDT